MSRNYVFVYGTLKKGYPNHQVLTNQKNGNAKFVCKGSTLKKFPLTVTTPFCIPFLLDEEGQGKFIKGEVYDVDEQMLEILDQLEQHPKLYVRKPLNILRLADETESSEASHSTLQCQTYLLTNYLPTLINLPLLDSYEDTSGYVSSKNTSRTLDDVLELVKAKA